MSNIATIGYSVSAPDVPPLIKSILLSYGGSGGPGRVALTGSATYTVDAAFLPAAGAKLVLVTVDTVDDTGSPVLTPITIRRIVNGVTINDPLGPGGVFLLADPAPSADTTALSIVHTANAVVHVYLLG